MEKYEILNAFGKELNMLGEGVNEIILSKDSTPLNYLEAKCKKEIIDYLGNFLNKLSEDVFNSEEDKKEESQVDDSYDVDPICNEMEIGKEIKDIDNTEENSK